MATTSADAPAAPAFPPDAPTFPAPDNMPLLPEGVTPCRTTNWNAYGFLPSFHIRNGDPADVKPLLIKATIPQAYHWAPIDNLNPAESLKVIDAYIKSAKHQLDQHLAATKSEADRRKAAITLGTIRAVTTAYYRLGNADLISGETTRPKLRAYREPTGQLVYSRAADVGASPALDDPLILTETEQAVVAGMVRYALGVPPLQGYSLIMTNRHYLSDPSSQSRKAFMVVERAFWKSQAVANWYETGDIPDIAWHKACHPIQMSLLTSWAMDGTVKDALGRYGAGACASRLPPKEPILRAAKSYLLCIQAIDPLLRTYGGSIDYTKLSDAIGYAEAWPTGVSNVPEGDRPPRPSDAIDVHTNRKDAMVYLERMVARSREDAAFCYGFHTALSEYNQSMGGSAATDTLKNSFSLSKLKSDSYVNFVAGQQAFGDYNAARNAMRMSGQRSDTMLNDRV